MSSHDAGTPSSVTLPGFLKTRQPTKHSGVMSIWLSAIFPTKAGSVAQVVPTTDGLTSYAGTTCNTPPADLWRRSTTRGHIREWRYDPRRLCVDDLISYVSEEVANVSAENGRRRQPHCRLTPLSEEPPRISAYTFEFQKLVIGLHFLTLIVCVYLHFSVGSNKTHLFWYRVHIGCSRSSKVDNFGTNRKRACDFLLGRHCNQVLSCTISEIRRLGWTLRIFPTLLLFEAPARYVPFGISRRS